MYRMFVALLTFSIWRPRAKHIWRKIQVKETYIDMSFTNYTKYKKLIEEIKILGQGIGQNWNLQKT